MVLQISQDVINASFNCVLRVILLGRSNVVHQLPALELRLNLAEDIALNLQEKSAASCGSTECAGSEVFAV